MPVSSLIFAFFLKFYHFVGILLFQERWIVCRETNAHPVGISLPTDGQFCVALDPTFVKHVYVLKSVKILDDVVSVNLNSCVVLLYVHVIL